jgi:hypothetical protein
MPIIVLCFIDVFAFVDIVLGIECNIKCPPSLFDPKKLRIVADINVVDSAQIE